MSTTDKVQVQVSPSLCAATGFCERIAPDLFKVSGAGLAEVQSHPHTAEVRALAEEAEMACPTGAILVELHTND